MKIVKVSEVLGKIISNSQDGMHRLNNKALFVFVVQLISVFIMV